jgi:hypothetical protein
VPPTVQANVVARLQTRVDLVKRNKEQTALTRVTSVPNSFKSHDFAIWQ